MSDRRGGRRDGRRTGARSRRRRGSNVGRSRAFLLPQRLAIRRRRSDICFRPPCMEWGARATKAEKVFPHMSLLCREPSANVPAAPLTRPLVIARFQMKKNIPLPLFLPILSLPDSPPCHPRVGSLLCDWLHHHGIEPRHRRALS